MTSLVIKDLELNEELDQQAMRQIVGGSARANFMFQRPGAQPNLFAKANAAPLGSTKVQASPLLRSAFRR